MDRLEELRSHAILDTDPEVEMDEIAQMANAIFNTPISVVSFTLSMIVGSGTKPNWG